MKKHFILLLVSGLFALTSCSSDDDAAKDYSVVGTWQLESTNPVIPGLDPEACPERPQITFKPGGGADWIFYSQENCEAQNASGSWSQKSGTEYSITIPDYGTFDGTVTFESAHKFTFSTTYQSYPVELTFKNLL